MGFSSFESYFGFAKFDKDPSILFHGFTMFHPVAETATVRTMESGGVVF